ncbi:class I adenylate-forming enzyme family protein [Aeribacillus pallidus]|uniref:Long-chain acyl-CoA synthetase n=1 Tax=Aeribacillus pallidus TaxID=33936 RepID=A0A161ZQF4_9BACI|nr:class I adenylate-forming enzyme family protein [Aeribacillus pallidus]KZN95087.1 long-chain acyl-CoA synthetase [Aeribacillus pallidus]
MNNYLFSVFELVEHTVKAYKDKEVLYDLKNRLTYGEFFQEANRLAAGLKKLGINKGDRVAVCLPNWNETAVIFVAAAKIGAILVPFNPKYKHHEVEYILKNSEPKVLFVTEQFDENIGFKQAFQVVKTLISVRFEHPDLLSYQEVASSASEDAPAEKLDVNNDLFCLLYTSGTTGIPKGVMISHRAIVQSANIMAKTIRCTEKDVFIVPAPLFHIFGMAVNLFCAISCGARIILQEKYHPKETLKLIEQEKVTIKQGVPAMFIKELEQEDFEDYDLSSLRAGIVGASPIPPNKVKEIRERMGINLCQSYGITETGSVTATDYDEQDERVILETVGKPIEGVKLKIVDENRQELPPGEVGEIAIHSFGTMKGYYKMKEQTEQVLDKEGWFYTGDLGVLDEKGNLRFVGRKKEMIIRGGFNIYPQEVEAVLTKHPQVVEAAVIGLPDEVMGESVCAVIKLKKGAACTEEELKEFVKAQMASYKVPNKIIFTEDFPVTASGKIQKVRLKDQVMEKFNFDA